MNLMVKPRNLLLWTKVVTKSNMGAYENFSVKSHTHADLYYLVNLLDLIFLCLISIA